jgi:UDP-N-acetylglucosamine enolpyruvyl transferase
MKTSHFYENFSQVSMVLRFCAKYQHTVNRSNQHTVNREIELFFNFTIFTELFFNFTIGFTIFQPLKSRNKSFIKHSPGGCSISAGGCFISGFTVYFLGIIIDNRSNENSDKLPFTQPAKNSSRK